MQQLMEYLVKLSGSLTIVYLFYFLLLRGLTFYNSNRYYLLGYSIISFFIPFVDITPLLEEADFSTRQFIEGVPVLDAGTLTRIRLGGSSGAFWNSQNVFLLLISFGIVFMLLRFLVQFLSLLSVRRASQLLSDGEIKLYHTDKNIIPFSFGDSIFINKNKHNPEELSEIIMHEFIHVRQKHTFDILLSEWICILNWYNPFAWLIRNDIRQNLEFIADDKVLQNGIHKKEYQYMLIKVVGEHRSGFATNFNYASLKKRIAMMNKIKSAKIHFIKFLFVVPLLAVILLSFRNKDNTQEIFKRNSVAASVVAEPTSLYWRSADSIPRAKHPKTPTTQPNQKGYIITVADNQGECIVIIRNRVNTIIKAITLVDWNENQMELEAEYGEIPPAPHGSPARVIIDQMLEPHPVPTPVLPEMPENILDIHVNDKKLTLTLKNGKTEVYNLENLKQRTAFEKKYGPIKATGLQQPNPGPNPENHQNPERVIDKKEDR